MTRKCQVKCKNNKIDGLNDSKLLSKKNRLTLEKEIKSKALAYGIGICSPKEIDEINILQASFLAMHRAMDSLKVDFNSILVDGNRFVPYLDIEHHCIIKGDSKFQSIAAASILAKTERDRIMENLHEDYPVYNWKQNAGYPTKEHRAAIAEFGSCEHHRHSFQLLPVIQTSLF